MGKHFWEIPDPPAAGDTSNDVTFHAVGAALSQWEYFEGNLSLTFSYLIGTGFRNIASMRAYGSVENFRGRHNMIENAAEVYFRYNPDKQAYQELKSLLKLAMNHLSGRRNEIAHGIVQPYFVLEAPGSIRRIQKGYVLYPAIYAARKYDIPDAPPMTETTITPKYIYSSSEIHHFGAQFQNLANRAINVLTALAHHEQRQAAARRR